jgi:hypothetical protein
MSYLALPLAALESPDYLALSLSDQKFLIDLYISFHDCERFTVEMDHPELYRQPAGATLQRKVAKLLAAGLIRVVDTTGRGNQIRRVFCFAYPALDAIAEAA